MTLFFIWAWFSPNNILDQDPRCMFYLTGTVFANICCKLIIAQMSNTRSELLSVILVPTLVAVILAVMVPGISQTTELFIMYSLTGRPPSLSLTTEMTLILYLALVTLAHIHYGTCVVLEMCHHFNIRPFTISQAGTEADREDKQGLLDSPPV